MLSIRLPENLEDKLATLAKNSQITKTEIVKNALTFYLQSLEMKNSQTPYDLGKDLFGKYGSSDGELSVTYKEKLKKRLSEKYNH